MFDILELKKDYLLCQHTRQFIEGVITENARRRLAAALRRFGSRVGQHSVPAFATRFTENSVARIGLYTRISSTRNVQFVPYARGNQYKVAYYV